VESGAGTWSTKAGAFCRVASNAEVDVPGGLRAQHARVTPWDRGPLDVSSVDPCCPHQWSQLAEGISVHWTERLTVAVLLAIFGSVVSAMVAAFSVIIVPDGAVTFTVRRTVHVVFGAMLLFS
jgi:hypothetical protein